MRPEAAAGGQSVSNCRPVSSTCEQVIGFVFVFGQKFEKVENGENRFFAITSSKLVRNWFCKKHLVRNHIFHNFCLNYGL